MKARAKNFGRVRLGSDPQEVVVRCLIAVGAVPAVFGIAVLIAAIFSMWKGWIGA